MSYNIDDDLDIFLQEPFGQEVEYSGGLRMGVLVDFLSQPVVRGFTNAAAIITVSYTHLTLPTKA